MGNRQRRAPVHIFFSNFDSWSQEAKSFLSVRRSCGSGLLPYVAVDGGIDLGSQASQHHWHLFCNSAVPTGRSSLGNHGGEAALVDKSLAAVTLDPQLVKHAL